MTKFSSLNKKSISQGFYVDNYLNRKLGRVGMPYSTFSNSNSEEPESDNEDRTIKWDKKDIIEVAKKSGISEEGVAFLENNFTDSIIAIGNKVKLISPLEINPTEENTKYFFIGKQSESRKNVDEKENHESGFAPYSRLYSKDEIEKMIFGKEGTYHKGTLEAIQNSLKTKALLDKYYSEEEQKTNKHTKDSYKYSKKYTKLIEALKKQGLDFSDLENINSEENKKKLKNFIANSSRTDFYNALKIDESFVINYFMKARFLYRYNKELAGTGWHNFTGNHGIIIGSKRDSVFNLASQLEYAIDDVLKDDKDKLFVNNENLKYLNYDDTDWESCTYSYSDKSINVTKGFLDSFASRKLNKNISTLVKEKYFVGSFLHEVGHSTEGLVQKYDEKDFEKFAEYLGFDKNKDYTVYSGGIRNKDREKIENLDYYLRIERDKKQDLIDKFKNIYDESNKHSVIYASFDDSVLNNIFLSSYSTKSASEGYAEYFSFYISNKEKIDKDIKDYKANPDKFVKEKDMKDWFKLHIANTAWQRHEATKAFSETVSYEEKYSKDKYYQKVVQHNIEMLNLIANIVNKIK